MAVARRVRARGRTNRCAGPLRATAEAIITEVKRAEPLGTMGLGPNLGSDARLPALRSALAALELGADAQVQRQLLSYLDLLAKWNRHFNLTAVREPQSMLGQHLFDCLAVLPAIDRQRPSLTVRVLDAGSGGGLPGVVLAIMRPGWSVYCVDAVAKKAGFVRQVAAELSLPNLHGIHARVETLEQRSFDLITSRAFASLAEFVRLTRAQIASSGCWMAMKGRHPAAEIADLPGDVEVFHVEPLTVPGLAAERCLVWIRRASL